MWELDHKESWTPQNWCFWTVVLEKTLESPLDSREIKSLNPKGNQPRTFVGRTDAETEYSLEGLMLKLKLQYFGHLMRKADSLEKTLTLEKIEWRQEKEGMTEDEMVGWYHWTWVWASSRRWWKTGKPGVLQSMGSRRVGHDWELEQQRQYKVRGYKK